MVNKVAKASQFNRVVKTISETAESYLDVRTVVLGKVPYLSGTVNFDNDFIYGKNNPSHKSALNILSSLVDRIDEYSLLPKSQQANPLNLVMREHEVQDA